MLATLLAVLLLAVLFLWFVRKGERVEMPRQKSSTSDIDHAELEAAEREVRDLDPSIPPEQGFEGDDWGPGVPRPPERL